MVQYVGASALGSSMSVGRVDWGGPGGVQLGTTLDLINIVSRCLKMHGYQRQSAIQLRGVSPHPFTPFLPAAATVLMKGIYVPDIP